MRFKVLSFNKALFSVLIFLIYSNDVVSLEVKTHTSISKESAQRSVLYSPGNILEDIGIDYISYRVRIDDTADRYEIFEAVGLGAEFEDNTDKLPRPLNHFYDPVNKTALVGDWFAFASPDWALEDVFQAPDQEYSLQDARGYFYNALTAFDESVRNENFALLFRTLGQVIHHVQDMSQPQHVRNDAHCDHSCEYLEIFGAYEPSIYEKYTKKKDTLIKQYYSGYPPVNFRRARDYWTTDAGTGLADYTNRNFFITEETNFNRNGNFVITQYAKPVMPGQSERMRG